MVPEAHGGGGGSGELKTVGYDHLRHFKALTEGVDWVQICCTQLATIDLATYENYVATSKGNSNKRMNC